MATPIISPVTTLLDAHQISFEQIEIPLSPDKKPIRALEEILGEHDYPQGAVVRSIVFRTDSGQFVLLAIAGTQKADWAVLRKHLDERRLTMAEPLEVTENTGYVIGAVPPIALPDAVRVLVDNSVKSFDKLIIGSGVLGYAFGLSTKDLLEVLASSEFGDFGKA